MGTRQQSDRAQPPRSDAASVLSDRPGPRLLPRHSIPIDVNGATRWGAHPDQMIHTPELVRHFPVLRLAVLHRLAPTHVPVGGTPVAAHVGANCAACDSTTHRGDVIAGAMSDLVSEHSAYDCADGVRTQPSRRALTGPALRKPVHWDGGDTRSWGPPEVPANRCRSAGGCRPDGPKTVDCRCPYDSGTRSCPVAARRIARESEILRRPPNDRGQRSPMRRDH